MKRVLLCSNNEALGLKVLYCLRVAGYRVDILSTAADNVTRLSRYSGGYHELEGQASDEATLERAIDWINREAPGSTWDAIVADDIPAHGLLHRVRPHVTVPAFAPSPLELLARCHDKWSFYSRLNGVGIPVPPSTLVSSRDAITRSAVEAVGLPLLVKPLNAESSRGIRKIESFSALEEFLDGPGPYRGYPCKLQRFINGHTIGLSLLALEGKLLSYDVQFHADGGDRRFYEDADVVEIGRRIVRAFSYGGPGHIDFIKDDRSGEVYALELNCRFWYSVTVSLWRGGNFPALAVRLARGEPVPECTTQPGSYFQPGQVVRMLRHAHLLAQLDQHNWRGFWQATSDPVPHVAHALRKRRSRM